MPWRDEPEEWEVCSRCGLLQAECICPPAPPEPPSEPQTWDEAKEMMQSAQYALIAKWGYNHK